MDFYKRYLGWFKRHWKLSLFMFIVLPILLGILWRITGATFSIYSAYGVSEVRSGYSGGFWDKLWMFRGQPPGYEHNPDGYFAIRKLDLSGDGLNGPLNALFLPFEFILVDLMIYAPAFLFGGINVVLHLDLFGLFWGTKIMADGVVFAAILVIFAIPIIFLVLLAPFLLGWFGLPLIKFILTWSVFNGLNLLKLIIVLLIFSAFIITPLVLLNPDLLHSLKFW